MRRILFLFVTLFPLMAAAYGQGNNFPPGQVGVQYTFIVDPICAVLPDCVALHIVSGALPPGLGVGPGFSITGVPTQAGTFYFSLEGGENIGPTSITVINGGPVIQSESPPPAGVGTPYNAPVSVLGGTPPYKWSAGLESGSVPPGLAFVSTAAGEAIAGTPTQGGNYLTSVDVVDSTWQGYSLVPGRFISVANFGQRGLARNASELAPCSQIPIKGIRCLIAFSNQSAARSISPQKV